MFWQRFRKILLYILLSIVGILLTLLILAYVYQDKLKAAAVQQINHQLKGELILKGDISISFIKHFPNASVSFHQIILHDKIKNHSSFIDADEFDAGFNMMKIFKGEYVLDAIYLKNTKVNVVLYKDGTNNYDVFSSSNKKSKNTSLEIKKVVIENSMLMVNNQPSKFKIELALNEFLGYGIYENSLLKTDFTIDAQLTKNSTSLPVFIFEKKISVNGKSTMDMTKNDFEFPYIGLSIAENELELSGDLKLNKQFSLNFKGHNFDVKNLTQLLDEKTKEKLKGTKAENLLDNFNGKINYNFLSEKLMISGGFNCGDGSLQIADWNNQFKNISCDASFNYSNNLFNFELKKFNAQFQNSNFSLSSHYQFLSGEQKIAATISGNLNLKNIIELFPVEQIEKLDGTVHLDSLQTMMTFNNKSNLNYLSLKNSIAVEQLELKTKNGYVIEKLNAVVEAFTDDNLIIKNGSGIINGNEIQFSGNSSYQNFMHEIKTYTKLKIQAENLDINSLLVASNESKKDSIQNNNWIDFPLIVELNCKKANWNKFKMQNTHAEVDLNKNLISINQFKTETQNGNLQLVGSLIQNDKTIDFNCKADYKNLNITSTFEQFENFNQTMLKSENVNGNLSGTTTATGKFDKGFHPISKSITSSSDISVDNGELKNVTQLLSLSKYLNVDDLKYLKFATLKNQIEISNGKIIIPEMRIQNNALNINVSGTHTFDNEMDYLFKINLMDWFGKKLGKNNDDNWEEDNEKKGFNVFLRMTGKGNDIKISRDKKSSRDKFKENLKAEHETMKALLKS
ncbi:MAG: hypothetical protein RL065_563, partial [Bacteroidota bacterium]